MSPPRVAVRTDIGISQEISAPSRSKILCGATFISTYRSPVGPPFFPASPSPVNLILSPLSTPGGTLMDRVFVFDFLPKP